MKKLLTKPLKTFTLYALLVLSLSVPVYYYMLNYIMVRELDEHNQLLAEYTRSNLKHNTLNIQQLDTLLSFWNKVQPGVTIQPSPGEIQADSMYTIMRSDKHVSYEPVDGFRGLATHLDINGRPYRLTIETNIEETHTTIGIITFITILFFLLLVGGFLILNRQISIRIWQPFEKTLSKLKNFDLNSGSPLVLEPSNIIEFQELNKVIEKLIARNLVTFNLQKEFTENASHELQTPLAIMQSKLDLLLQEHTLSKEQHQLIQELNMALTRASRVNKSLLILAKIDNEQFGETENINLGKELNLTLSLLTEHLLQKKIQLQADIQEEVYVRANRILLEILIQNLLFNAYRHSTTGAVLKIKLTPDLFWIANSGLEALPVGQLFKRFSPASKGRGTGLGLAIVKQVSTRYHWKVSYAFEDKFHCFYIHFK